MAPVDRVETTWDQVKVKERTGASSHGERDRHGGAAGVTAVGVARGVQRLP